MQGKSANTTEQKSFVFMATETIIKHSPLDISMLLHISGAHSFLLLTIMWLLCATTFFTMTKDLRKSIYKKETFILAHIIARMQQN